MPRCSVVLVLLLSSLTVAVRDATVARVALSPSSMASFASFAWRSSATFACATFLVLLAYGVRYGILSKKMYIPTSSIHRGLIEG